MTESYKYKSKIATAVAFIATIVVCLGKDGLSKIVPQEYVWIIPVIVGAASWVLAQKTEDKRVDVAEQIVYEKLDGSSPDPAAEYENLNDEYSLPIEDDEDGC